jgi:hypothetical protein
LAGKFAGDISWSSLSGASMKLKVLCPRRRGLEANVGQTIRVVATYLRMGSKKVGSHDFHTILLGDIRDAETGELLADHVWFNRGSLWRKAALVPGDLVRFCARPIEYRTGYWGPNQVRQLNAPARYDYRLSTPKGLEVIRRETSDRWEAA